MTATALAPAFCKTCNQGFHYEPILGVNNVDFGNISGLCPTCEAELERRRETEKAAERRALAEAVIETIIPEDIRATTTDHPEFNTALWNQVRHWRPSADSYWLSVIGRAGRCKTRCIALLAMNAIRWGVPVTWTTSFQIKDAAADRNRDTILAIPAREHLGKCKRTAWLFIDDLGKQGEWTASFEAAIFEILDHRKAHRLTTVFSSNSHPEEFSQLISPVNVEPIIGRLLDRTTLIHV
jgi:hypothetical protein